MYSYVLNFYRYTIYMYRATYQCALCYSAVPGQVDNVNITCGPVDLINRCTVTWNVSTKYVLYCTDNDNLRYICM